MKPVHAIFLDAGAPEVGSVLTHVQMLDNANRNRVLRGGWSGNEIRHRLPEPHPGGYFSESASYR